MKDIETIFRPDDNTFTVFVVEQRFAVNRGAEYFRSFRNTTSFFDSDAKIEKRFRRIISTIEKGVVPVSSLINVFSSPIGAMSIGEAITSLCKLFTVTEHQAAGPEVIDPIILQEGSVTKKALTKLVHLHKDSILRPSIIILLKDNDFERAKSILSECPHGINIKMVRNSGEEEIHKVINCGSDNIDSFISSFAEQCYSTCSKTRREVLLNSTWSENPTISKYSPQLFKIRTNLIFDEKDEIRNDLDLLIGEITQNQENVKSDDEKLFRSLEFTAKMFRVFCNDIGGTDIIDAERLAKSLENELLFAQLYRYAYFLPNCSENRKKELFDEGCAIFRKNGMEDQYIYCLNNKLIQQFYTDTVTAEEFRAMQIEAVNNVPGMVAMSHIFNNVGVAYLYCGQSDSAIEFFTKGLDYAKYQGRLVQKLAIESNMIIAECYSYSTVAENRLKLLMRRIFDGMGLEKLPFLSADYVLNILAVSYKQSPLLAEELIHSFPIKKLIDSSFRGNYMGVAERVLQMQCLASHFSGFRVIMDNCAIPKLTIQAKGKRATFISQYGLSPFDFATWL